MGKKICMIGRCLSVALILILLFICLTACSSSRKNVITIGTQKEDKQSKAKESSNGGNEQKSLNSSKQQ